MDKHIINISQRNAIPFGMDSIINFHDLTFVKKGVMEYIIDGTEYTLSQGMFLYVPSGSHRVRKEGCEQASYISINFTDKNIDCQDLKPVIYVPDTFELHFYINEIIKSYYNKSEYTEQKNNLLLNLIIYHLKEQSNPLPANKYTQKIKEYIARNIEQDITLEGIAGYVHLSPTYCSHIFRKYENETIKSYIRELRLKQACEMLAYTNHSISYIAESLGYCDLFYFSNIFKKNIGVSPTEYRNLNT